MLYKVNFGWNFSSTRNDKCRDNQRYMFYCSCRILLFAECFQGLRNLFSCFFRSTAGIMRREREGEVEELKDVPDFAERMNVEDLELHRRPHPKPQDKGWDFPAWSQKRQHAYRPQDAKFKSRRTNEQETRSNVAWSEDVIRECADGTRVIHM